MTGYDIVGDVHGCADKLKGLLGELGYSSHNGVYSYEGNDDRQAIFVGDLIDRGHQQIETLEIVRAMVKAGSAQVVMGNHEFNAISYSVLNKEIPGEYSDLTQTRIANNIGNSSIKFRFILGVMRSTSSGSERSRSGLILIRFGSSTPVGMTVRSKGCASRYRKELRCPTTLS